MNPETWSLINRGISRFRSSWSEHVDGHEFDKAFAGLPMTEDYREVVLRYGGVIVGTYPIYGLRLAQAMGTIARKGTAPEITTLFRDRKWPGVENWFSVFYGSERESSWPRN
jgi:hypothetical protein